MYAYNTLQTNGSGLKWNLMMVDFDTVFSGNPTNDILYTNVDADDQVTAMIRNPALQRSMWRCFFDLANTNNGLMLASGVNPVFDGHIAALAANGYTVPSTTNSDSDQNWIAARRAYLWGRLAEVRPLFQVLSAVANASATNVTLTGHAPVEVKEITLNSNVVTVTWTTVTNWSFTAAAPGANNLQITGWDRKGNVLTNLSAAHP